MYKVPLCSTQHPVSGSSPIDPVCTSHHSTAQRSECSSCQANSLSEFLPESLLMHTAISKQISQYGCKLYIMSMIMKGHESAFPTSLAGRLITGLRRMLRILNKVGRTAVLCINASASAVYHLHLLFFHDFVGFYQFCFENALNPNNIKRYIHTPTNIH